MNQHTVNVLDFGADPKNQKDSTSAFQEAINAKKNQNGGLIVQIPGGEYKIAETLCLPEQVILKGPGTQESTTLDFSDQQEGPGILIQDFGMNAVEGLLINRPKGNGIEVQGTKEGKELFQIFFHLTDVRVKDAGLNGFHLENAWMASFDRCYAEKSGKSGFYFAGFHTSLNLSNCYASHSGDTGFHFNNTVYSNLTSCGSDGNGSYGYFLVNCQAIMINACGAEGNQHSSIGMAAHDGWASSLPDSYSEHTRSIRGIIDGITIQSFYSMDGNVSDDSGFGEYLTLHTDHGRLIRGSSHNHFHIQRTAGRLMVVKRGLNYQNNIDFPIYQGSKIVP